MDIWVLERNPYVFVPRGALLVAAWRYADGGGGLSVGRLFFQLVAANLGENEDVRKDNDQQSACNWVLSAQIPRKQASITLLGQCHVLLLLVCFCGFFGFFQSNSFVDVAKRNINNSSNYLQQNLEYHNSLSSQARLFKQAFRLHVPLLYRCLVCLGVCVFEAQSGTVDSKIKFIWLVFRSKWCKWNLPCPALDDKIVCSSVQFISVQDYIQALGKSICAPLRVSEMSRTLHLKPILLLLLRSNAGMVMSDLEVDVLDELGSVVWSSSLDRLASGIMSIYLSIYLPPRWPCG